MEKNWNDDDFFQNLANRGLEPEEVDYERYGQLRELRLKVILRGLVLLVVAGFGAYFAKNSLPDIQYFLSRNQPASELGDLRNPALKPDLMKNLESNREIRFSNDVITVDKIRSDDKEYYFSPITNCIVRTPQTLPDKTAWEMRVVEMDLWESELVASRKAFPADLRVTIDGDGRYFSPADQPRWMKPLIGFFAEQTMVPADEICIIFDKELPGDNWVSLVVVAAAAGVMLVTLLVFLAALRKYLIFLKGE